MNFRHRSGPCYFRLRKIRLQVSEFQNTVANHRHSQRKPARVTT